MTSVRKIEANRRNSRKSCGPRTAAGKSIASRNALRHGLAALTHRRSVPAPEVEEFARVLCDDDNDPVLFAQAVQIAQNEMALRAVRAHRVYVIERLREPYQLAFAKKDNSLELGKARYMEGWLAEREIEKRLPKVLEKYRDRMGLAHATAAQNPAPWADDLVLDAETLDFYKTTDWARLGPWDMIVPVQLKALLQEPDDIDKQTIECARKRVEERQQIEGRDEYEALEAAILDLKRLDRYERRAWSQQKRAIREFMRIKTTGTDVHPTSAVEERVS
jgi:hypothetical protein